MWMNADTFPTSAHWVPVLILSVVTGVNAVPILDESTLPTNLPVLVSLPAFSEDTLWGHGRGDKGFLFPNQKVVRLNPAQIRSR